MMNDIRRNANSLAEPPSRIGLLVQRLFPNLPDWMWVALGAIPRKRQLFVEADFLPARPRLKTPRRPMLPRERRAARIPTMPIVFPVTRRATGGLR